jgi:hypothetical protein
METVYVLHHIRKDDKYGDNAKLIGIYRSKNNANDAIRRLAGQPGFRDHPKGFHTEPYELDRDHWTEGFGFSD